jgi:hypothetical protein
MIELSREETMNHPGLLILDEPRQQSTRVVSFAELMKRASSATVAKQQVIFFTSESTAILKQALNGLPHTLIECEGRMLKKI